MIAGRDEERRFDRFENFRPIFRDFLPAVRHVARVQDEIGLKFVKEFDLFKESRKVCGVGFFGRVRFAESELRVAAVRDRYRRSAFERVDFFGTDRLRGLVRRSRPIKTVERRRQTDSFDRR